MSSRNAPRLALGGLLFALTGAGCSLIVSGDVPEFSCSSDSPADCPSGLVCDTSVGKCRTFDAGLDDTPVEDPDADVPEEDAAADAQPDAPTGPLPLGGKCRVDSDCKSKLCGTSTFLTTPIVSSTGPICTKTCCTSADCDAGFVCFGGGTGGNYCVPQAKAQRTPPSSGGKLPGVACTKHSDCRSGLCTDNKCTDTCCAATDCAAGSVCRITNVAIPSPGHDTWACAAAESGAKAVGATCVDQPECVTSACFGISPNRTCRPPCSNTAACKAISGFTNGHCIYSANSDYVRFCVADAPATNDKGEGEACSLDGECKSDFCDPELRKCAEFCARDVDCASGKVCRPSSVGTPFLRCVAGVR